MSSLIEPVLLSTKQRIRQAVHPVGRESATLRVHSLMRTLANSEYPDDISHNAAFHLGIHCSQGQK